MEKKNRRQLVSGSVGEEHGSHQITQTSRKPNRLKNQQYFLNPVGKRRTQGKPLPLSLERQTGEYRSHNLLEQRLGRRNSSNQGSARKWVLLEAHADKSDG